MRWPKYYDLNLRNMVHPDPEKTMFEERILAVWKGGQKNRRRNKPLLFHAVMRLGGGLNPNLDDLLKILSVGLLGATPAPGRPS